MSLATSSYSGDGRVKVVAGYALQGRLGSGSFANVYKAVRLPNNTDDNNSEETVAIKAIARTSEKLTKKVLQNLEIEISILRTYRHQNIVCLHNVIKTEKHFYLLLEYCSGGDLQSLIRSRKAGRLSEILTRRLMRDLAAGLQFLWGQELIHRDLKPQNLLMSGLLPLEEVDDPAKTPALEEERRQANFSSAQFALKIADFGFARHLQSASLAETLCGSPIYMAPEILQHQRYDAKADLWSVGTVLFEMISGRPPFHGENHIDLLRNIQRKAVRLPPDVRISKECVNLLRLLLHRNPLSRAGFKEFFEACDVFVSLGCRGEPKQHDPGTITPPQRELVTIPENDGTAPQDASLVTVATTAAPTRTAATPRMVTPQFGPAPTPPIPTTLTKTTRQQYIAPLVPSPPTSGTYFQPSAIPEPPQLDLAATRQVQMVETSPRRQEIALQHSSEENSFVMVEHGSSMYNNNNKSPSALVSTDQGYFFGKAPVLSGRNDYMVPPKGMLSTSPGTGGALMGLLSGGRARLTQQATGSNKNLEAQISDTSKTLAAAEDIGRRAISVAHLGDNRAYMAMKLILMSESGSSVTPMEGIIEDSHDHDSGTVTDDSSSTEIMTSTRRRRSSSATSMADAKTEEAEEMPFAVQEAAPLMETVIPTRGSMFKGSSSISATSTRPQPTMRPTPAAIRSFFNDALSCYLKTLKMLKVAVGAVEKVKKEIKELEKQRLAVEQRNHLQKLNARCEVTAQWLTGQFRGVLERGDAANVEIGKIQVSPTDQTPVPVSVEELLYNHALGNGREGAVKQLLGQYEAARACYRSAGLLAETLLMEPSIQGEDRKTLEDYVDGFAARIKELDETILHQSRMSSATSSTLTRKSVVALVGHPLDDTPRPGFM